MKLKFNINIDIKQILSENMLYGMVWLVVFLVPILNSKLMAEEHVNLNNIIIAWCKIAPYFIIFLIHNIFIAPKLLIKRRYLWYILSDIVLLATVFAVVDLYEHYVEGKLFVMDMPEYIPRHRASLTDLQWHWNMLLGIFMLGTNAGVKLIFKSIADERKMEVLKRRNLQAEMEYLKYQINPHFFMNTLNNIHALIDIDTECAKDSVIELSKMMRYVLYESGARNISLQNELQFVSNYINLMRIRYTKDIDITFNKPRQDTSRIFIPPLLFIVFVENAFKHGVSYNTPSFIRIDVSCDDKYVCCSVINSRTADASASHKVGIGLDNVTKRLELLYNKDYVLEINDTDPQTYGIKLIIPISE